MAQSYLNMEGLNEIYLPKDKKLKKDVELCSIKDLVYQEPDEIKKITKDFVEKILNLVKDDEKDFANCGFTITNKIEKKLIKNIEFLDKINKYSTVIDFAEINKFHQFKLRFNLIYGKIFKNSQDYYKYKFRTMIMQSPTFYNLQSVIKILDNKYLVVIFFKKPTTFSSNPEILNVYTATAENPYEGISMVMLAQIIYDDSWFKSEKD